MELLKDLIIAERHLHYDEVLRSRKYRLPCVESLGFRALVYLRNIRSNHTLKSTAVPKFLHSTAFVFFLSCSSISFAAGELLVADRSPTSPAVSRYDAETGEFLGELISGNPEVNGGLLFPSAMTIGPGGNLLIASQIGSVLQYDIETGDFLGAFAQQLNVPSGLLFNEEKDELLVSTLGNFDSELILQYKASTGELLGTIGEGTGMSGRGSMTIGPDGDVYASSFANGEFFLGSVLQFDGDTLESKGTFANDPFVGLAGASGLVFHDGDEEGTYQLDVVGLFSNSVARFAVSTTDDGLTVDESTPLITADLDFPSAIQPLGDGSMLITNLGNDNPATGDLRPGSIGRFDVATGAFMDTFVAAGGEGMLSQPSALLLLSDGALVPGCNYAEQGFLGGDFDGDGSVVFADFVILSNNYGQAVDDYSDGDIDCNGEVGFTDFLIMSANFGEDFGQAEAASVPEPRGWLMVVIGMMTMLGLRRRRSR